MAEAEVVAAAVRLDLIVLRPLCDGGRYDLAVDLRHDILRVQCKWTRLQNNVISTPLRTSWHTPRGYVRTTYSRDEVDAIATYVPDTDKCYLIPIHEAADRSEVCLRTGPTRNNQAIGVRWARDYEFENSLQRNWPSPAR
jgi:PD-(D/E)XK nuclease superfamily protein